MLGVIPSIVDDVSDVRFVDAHAKGNGRYDALQKKIEMRNSSTKVLFYIVIFLLHMSIIDLRRGVTYVVV